jgi:hypothetical protein
MPGRGLDATLSDWADRTNALRPIAKTTQVAARGEIDAETTRTKPVGFSRGLHGAGDSSLTTQGRGTGTRCRRLATQIRSIGALPRHWL